jgi:protein tyrosine phosphatase (PTP) superfamily phosphohydrolase (DUF442 family)
MARSLPNAYTEIRGQTVGDRNRCSERHALIAVSFGRFTVLFRRVLVGLFLALTVPAAGTGAWLGYLQLTGNIQTVEPGILYRSGQLGSVQLAAVVDAYGIATIVNLRGAHPGAGWYDDEVRTAAAMGVLHIDVPMSARQQPAPAAVAQLLDAFRMAPRPILVHCQGGADRSGFASAVFELLVMDRPIDEARRQLSIRYGHFPWLISRSGAMDRAFISVVTQRPWGAPVEE